MTTMWCDWHLGPWQSDPSCHGCKDREPPTSNDSEDHAYRGDGTSGCAICYQPMNAHISWEPTALKKEK